jgi:hypothetical protein
VSGYRRQLSDAGALLAAVAVSALLVFSAVILFGGFVIFGPLLLVVTLGMLARELLRYPFRKRIELSAPAPLVLAGWALALPLAAVLVPILDLALRAAPRGAGSAAGGKDLEWAAYLGGVAATTLLATLGVCVRLYRATPADAHFEGELPRKGLGVALLSFSLQFLGMTFSLAGPLAVCLGFFLWSRRGSPGEAAFARAALWIGAVPAFVVGLALVRRAFWTLEIDRLVADHPRSTVRAAALGLVELHGTARPLEGDPPEAALLLTEEGMEQPVFRVGDFALDDGTGSVVVRVPPGGRPGLDGVLDLEVEAGTGGHQRTFALRPGDPVVVLGELVAGERGRELRPWTPPFGRRFAGLTRDLFDQDWSFGGGIDYQRALGLRLHPEVFALTDGPEERLRRLVRRRWAGSLVLGLLLVSGAAALLLRVSA